MGRRGPKPEPASIKKQKASSRRPIGEDATAQEAETNVAAAPSVSPPAWLKKDGLVVWKRLAPRLIGQKLLSRIDAETFARYCKNFARWLKMQQRLDEMGEIYEIKTASGTVRRADPAYMIADRLERQLVTAEASFGLNPAERQRIFAARAANPLGDLFEPSRASEQPKAPGKKPTQMPDGSAVGFLN
ncbi:phage terminase small subunit P27 family [Mesorhizobium xinjiangense]|uniref:phage terminase small subunit P27 family n=1 Tax=Mesorhizobium xinjiangense TaxID=2678685 RepID=UPI0012ECC7FC|nr:phage terminase small subunit P27 family [Mesorhizobium xinjiangense]